MFMRMWQEFSWTEFFPMYFPLPPPIRPWRKFTAWYLLRSKGISSLFHQTLQDLPLTYSTLPPSEASYFWLHILCGTDFFLFISPTNSDFYLNFYRVMVIWTDIPVKLATSVSPVCLFGGDGNNLVFISSATIYLTREILASSRQNWLYFDLWKQSFLTRMCFSWLIGMRSQHGNNQYLHFSLFR